MDFSGGLGLGRSTPVAAPARPVRPAGFSYSSEQQEVIDCNDDLVVVDAFAGCGKTTTAVGYCEARPDESILYIVLNAANAAEAKARFPKNVQAMTTHSLAWTKGGMGKHVGQRNDFRWRAMSIMQQFRITDPAAAWHAQQVLQKFFGSSDREISEKHVEELAQKRDLAPRTQMTAVANARFIWKRMQDPNDKCSIPPDAYLKMFALRSPQLGFDRIIFDEAQDANPVTTQIVLGQLGSKLLAIGDRHQSIYQFRGSENAMEKLSVGARRFHITETYRFGPKIAEIANLILGELKGETHAIKGMAADGLWTEGRHTKLSRTNSQLFALAAERRGEGIYWVGPEPKDGYKVGRDGPDNYRLSLVMDAYHLFNRERAAIQDKTMKEVGSWQDYTTYAEQANDGEARILVKLIEEHGHDTPQLVEDIRRNAVPREADADMVLTTAHKSKGLEWDRVQLTDDFEFLEDLEFELSQDPNARIPVQDVNLLYVAATRAKQAVTLNKETVTWIEKLPEHRENRRLASTRRETRAVNGELSAMRYAG